MGGQACVLYGAAEFSRDTDLAILAERENLNRLQSALDSLQAKRIAVPSFEASYLRRGHGVHFRCHHPEAKGMRIDVMSVMRNVAPFTDLWNRRTTVETNDGDAFDILSLPDLIQAKKTQRDKDWPLIRRLVEAHFFQNQDTQTPEQVTFWLRECRTPEILLELSGRFTDLAGPLTSQRPLLTNALEGDADGVIRALATEEQREREEDRLYWLPLKQELERLRHEAAG